MDPVLSRLTDTVTRARSLEDLTRPILEILADITGMESTYLTSIDLDAGVQHVQFARNTKDMEIPEGLDVPWSDTLCKRALDEGRPYTDDVASCWADSQAARALSIQTYASTAVKTHDGKLLGTLCSASAGKMPFNPAAEAMMQLFSRLIGSFVEREMLVKQLQVSNEELAALAMTDPLTTLANRRAIQAELPRMLAQARRTGTFVLIAGIDLDGFKAINDTRGHHVGDEFLQEISRRLTATVRAVDVVGRLGGDEFVVLAPGASTKSTETVAAQGAAAAPPLQQRLYSATMGRFVLPSAQFDYGGASIGVVAVDPQVVDSEQAMQLADAEMYRIKQMRKAARADTR